jgi:hypothetical protein
MPARSIYVLALGALLLTGSAAGADWEASLDARAVYSDAQRSFMDGGLGTTRYDSGESGAQLGQLRVALSVPLGELWNGHLDASVWDDKDRSPVGVTEAYLQFRPYPFSGYRLRVKAGAFYPPISLENRAAGWQSPYTLSASAINSWLGVELRTLGVEAQLDWLGTRTGHDFDLGLTGGAFGWNDGLGVVLASDGFMLTDRQTPVFGRTGRRGVPPLFGAEPFLELDHHVGAYAGVEARYLDRVELRLLRYDNRADPTQVDTVAKAVAWATRFNSAGLRTESAAGWTTIVQWLDGKTIIVPVPWLYLEWPFRAEFALVSKRCGHHTLSARYDRFEVDTNIPTGAGYQRGHAFTAAWVFDASERWRLALEWLRVRSYSTYREDFGGPEFATENQLQFSVRYTLGSR